MQVVLLAAGQSKRVKPIPDKNFIRFCGKYLMEWQLQSLKQAGFDDILIVGNNINLDKLKKITKNSENKNSLPKKIYFTEQKNLAKGMAGAILDSKKYLKKEILIVSSNDVVDIKAYELILKQSKNFDSAIIGYKVSKYFPGGYLEISNKGLVRNIIEKPEKGQQPSNMINLVIHYFKDSEKLLTALETEILEKGKDDLYERALLHLIKNGLAIKAVTYDGFWQALKYPWHVFDLDQYFFAKVYQEKIKHIGEGPNWISKSAEIAKNVVINGKVIIEAGAKIFDNAVIQGPTYIGKNSIVANNALLRHSFLGENCVIGFATEIARSHLEDDVWTHSNYIGDSFIGNNVSFGAGTVTGNLRLDEKNISFGDFDTGKNKFGLVTGDNIRCGINVSFMPGLKIGSNSIITAGIVISKDIEENSFVKGNFEIKVAENRRKILKREKL